MIKMFLGEYLLYSKLDQINRKGVNETDIF